MKSLTLGPGALGTSRQDGSGLARRSEAQHIGDGPPRSPPRLAWKGVRDAPRFGGDHAPPAEDPTRVTEIPEHLLKRSKERRSAIGGGDGAGRRRRSGERGRRGGPGGRRRPRRPGRRRRRGGPGAPGTGPPRGGRGPAPQEDPVLGDARAARPPAVGLRVPGAPSSRRPPARTTRSCSARRSTAAAPPATAPTAAAAAVPALTGVLETWVDPLDQMMWVRIGSEGWPGDTYGDTAKPKARRHARPPGALRRGAGAGRALRAGRRSATSTRPARSTSC